MRPIRMLTTGAVCCVTALLLAGCGVGGELTGAAPASAPGPVTVIVADVSGSTLARRSDYVSDAMTAIVATAELGGRVYLSTVDGLATDESWQIADRGFDTTIGGANQELARAARRVNAKRLRPRVERLVHRRGRGGTDLLAMLTNVRRLLCTLPDKERRVVLITDGAVVAGGVDLYRSPPLTRAARTRLITRLHGSDEIPPDLTCGTGAPVRIWLSELGAGIHRREVAIAVRRFFVEAIESTGAIIVADEPQLLKRSFVDSRREVSTVIRATARERGRSPAHARPRDGRQLS